MAVLSFTPPPTAPLWSIDTIRLPKLYGTGVRDIGRAKVAQPVAPCPAWCTEDHATDDMLKDGGRHHRAADQMLKVRSGWLRSGRATITFSVEQFDATEGDDEAAACRLEIDGAGDEEEASAKLSADDLRGLALAAFEAAAQLDGGPARTLSWWRLGQRWVARRRRRDAARIALVEQQAEERGFTDGWLAALREDDKLRARAECDAQTAAGPQWVGLNGNRGGAR